MTIKPTCVQMARDLLLPGLYRYDKAGDLRVDDNVLVYSKDGVPVRTVLTHEELDRPDWVKIAKDRLGWPT